MKRLTYFFLLVDISFVCYWAVTALHLIPAEYLYNDYKNPILVNWNWSFFPLDLLVSITGFYSLFLAKQGNSRWRVSALVSLLLTSVSGLQAIAYWTLARDFDLSWWLPNLFLLVYPLFFLPRLMKNLVSNGEITTQKRG